MTRKERSIQNSIDREKRARKLVKDTITGLYSHEFKWASGKWNIKLIAEHTGLHRDTVSKHLRIYESNKGGLFEEEFGTAKGFN